MPHNGLSYLYPTLDEYNMAETTTGLWSLDPLSGSLFQIDHNPSGDFGPSLDSFGRVVFTRWDHLERDQQTDVDVLIFHPCKFCTFNYASEAITATRLLTNAEVFPEPRPARTDELAGTNLAGQHMNEFLPWTINEDGTRAETINHIGRHELLFHIPAAFTDDPNLKPLNPATMFNTTRITKFLQMKEDPVHPGTYYGTDVYEGTHAAGQVISMTAPPGRRSYLAQLRHTPRDVHGIEQRRRELHRTLPRPAALVRRPAAGLTHVDSRQRFQFRHRRQPNLSL